MNVYEPLAVIGLMSLCVGGLGGGLVYAVRFLRQRGLVDTRFVPFLRATLLGDVRSGYRLFYRAYSEEHGRFRANAFLVVHVGSLLGAYAVPFLFE